MKKALLAVFILGTITSTPATAQGLLGKLKEKTKSSKSESADEAGTTVTDEWGISGSYFLSEQWEVDGKKVKKMNVEFVKEENGIIVNRLTVTTKAVPGKFKLDEKLFNKQGTKLFTGGFSSSNESFEIMQLDNGILFLNCVGKKAYLVMAKEEAALKDWDEETGLAKFDSEKKKQNAAATAALRKKLESNKAYKANIGKIVFAPKSNSFNSYQGADIATEDPANFITEWVTGNGLAMRAYFDKSFSETCNACDGKVNYILEMGKHKVDWMLLRSSSSAFSKLFAPSVSSNEYMTDGVWMWDNMDYNRALVMLIHKNIQDGSLKEGGKMNLKVSIYPYSDKTNGAKLAEGSLSVKYDANVSSWVNRYNAFKDAIE